MGEPALSVASTTDTDGGTFISCSDDSEAGAAEREAELCRDERGSEPCRDSRNGRKIAPAARRGIEWCQADGFKFLMAVPRPRKQLAAAAYFTSASVDSEQPSWRRVPNKCQAPGSASLQQMACDFWCAEPPRASPLQEPTAHISIPTRLVDEEVPSSGAATAAGAIALSLRRHNTAALDDVLVCVTPTPPKTPPSRPTPCKGASDGRHLTIHRAAASGASMQRMQREPRIRQPPQPKQGPPALLDFDGALSNSVLVEVGCDRPLSLGCVIEGR